MENIYEIMEEIRTDNIDVFIVCKRFAENHFNDECFFPYRKMTLEDIFVLGEKGDYLAKIFSNICWYYFM